MPYTVAAKNMMLDHLRAAITHASLHSGIPAAGNELNCPGYARCAISLQGAVGGRMSGAGEHFKLTEGSVVNHVGFWSAARGGVLLAWSEIDELKFDGDGSMLIESATLDLNMG